MQSNGRLLIMRQIIKRQCPSAPILEPFMQHLIAPMRNFHKAGAIPSKKLCLINLHPLRLFCVGGTYLGYPTPSSIPYPILLRNWIIKNPIFSHAYLSYNSGMSQLPIYTIGYGKREIGEFITLLKANDITYLIDVRSEPYSRHKPAFSKDALVHHLKKNGIGYVFMGDSLGGRPSDPNCSTNGKVDYEKVRQMPFFQAGIGRLQKAHQQKLPIALMCSEGKPEICHRSKLIGKTLHAQGIPLAHIDENGQLMTQEAVERRLDNGQKPLFPPQDEPFFNNPVDGPPPPAFPEFDDDFSYDGYMPADEEAYEPPDSPFLQMAAMPQHTGAMDVAAAHTLLKQFFGYDELRPLQPEVIQNVLDKKDSLAIMPTGSGKSLCYQLPALMFSGLTVVVSPLISLMADQVAQLQELGITAVYLNSTLHPQQQAQIAAQIRAGTVKLLYAAPETLMRPDTMRLLQESAVDCLTIDEAHCISAWGHDFRPEYRQLADLRRRLPNAVCLAVTATATDRVRQDIKRSLAIPDAGEFIASFDRKNLFLAVAPKMDGLRQALSFLDAHREQAGIIYCSTRKQVNALTADLAANGWPVLPYHAGLSTATRQKNQFRFTREEAVVMVATVAFGMGIDKSNVRFILHYDLPKNLESYYQQIGRAGRDGLPSDCLLLFSYSDVSTINYFINQKASDQQQGARMRLDAILRFVETAVCRRKPLLDYFGETYQPDNCKTCDNCTAEKEELTDLTILAQKFLSCVKRTGELFGVNHIIDVLRGSRSQKLLQKRHDRLSTYGIGRELSKKEWQHLSRQFVQQKLLFQDAEYGSLKLTPKAYAVFKGEKVMGILPKAERKTAVSHTQISHDPALFALLRAKRSELAAAGNVPPYVIFSDRSLVEMAAYFPQSQQLFGSMYGVGQAKLEKYTDDFLPIIQAYCQEHNIAEKPKAAAPSPARRIVTGLRSRSEEVIEAYNQGHTIAEIATDLGIKAGTVLEHLWKGVQAGRPLHPDRILAASQLSPELQQRILAAFNERGTDYLRPVFEAMEEQVGYDELKILRLYLVARDKLNV